jgi:hypothetical protein
VQRFDRATENDSPDAAPVDGAGAHGAGLGTRKKNALGDPVPAESCQGVTNEIELGVGRRAVSADRIASLEDHVAVDREQRPERVAARGHGFPSQLEAPPHQ